MPNPGASVSSLRHSADRLLVAFACLQERVRMVAFNGVRGYFATIVDGFDIHFSQELRMNHDYTRESFSEKNNRANATRPVTSVVHSETLGPCVLGKDVMHVYAGRGMQLREVNASLATTHERSM